VIESSPEEIRLAEEALSVSALAQVRELPTAQRTEVVLALAAAVARARGALPDLRLEPRAFAIYLLGHLTAETGDPAALATLLGTIEAGDLFLAFGCAQGDPRALAQFEGRYAAEIASIARRFDASEVDDLGQFLREKLLLAHGDRPPRISEYRGRGLLRNWVRVVALRTFIDWRRSAEGAVQAPESGDALEIIADESDLALALLKAQCRAEFKLAFSDATALLTSSERNLLRHHAVAGLSIDQIAAIYGIHRATAARRLADAKDRLVSLTRRELQRRLKLPAPELDTILALVRSQLELSLDRLLRSTAGSTTDRR
jgi:RNA polymerase sigma-70 factor